MTINCVIIDDEPLARKGLKEYIQDAEFLTLVGEYEHPMKAMSILTEQSVQLIFLDIQMPKITGIEFMNSLQHPPLLYLQQPISNMLWTASILMRSIICSSHFL